MLLKSNDICRKLNKHKSKLILLSGVLAVLIFTYWYITKINNMNVWVLLKNLFMLKYLPELKGDFSIGLIFLFGFLTSFHCIGMCGGFVISQCINKNDRVDKIEGKILLFPNFLYNVGRVLSYTLIGGLVGGIGQVVSLTGLFKGVIPIIGGIFMIIMAINLIGLFPALRRLNISMPYYAAKKVKNGQNYSSLYIGFLSGLMPCGPLQIVQLYALSTKSVFIGAASLFIFALGTVPLLFSFGALNTIISKKYSTWILKVSAVIVLILGVIMIGRGLTLSGISLYSKLPEVTANKYTRATVVQSKNDDLPKIEADNVKPTATPSVNIVKESPDSRNVSPNVISEPKGTSASKSDNTQANQKKNPLPQIQVVRTEIQQDSYPPILVQKGIPVKWIITAKEENLNECNNEITIPKLKIDKKFSVGENIIEFTPNESGDIPFSCWMGMIKSTITVVNDLNKKSN